MQLNLLQTRKRCKRPSAKRATGKRPGLFHFQISRLFKERFPVDVSPGQEEQPIYWFLVTNHCSLLLTNKRSKTFSTILGKRVMTICNSHHWRHWRQWRQYGANGDPLAPMVMDLMELMVHPIAIGTNEDHHWRHANGDHH